MSDQARLYRRMRGQIIVQTIGPGIHQGLEPGRAGGIIGLQVHRIDEQFHAQVLPDRGLALNLGHPALGIDEIGLNPVEIILSLGIGQTKYGVGIGGPVDMGNAPVIANDRDPCRLGLLPREIIRSPARRADPQTQHQPQSQSKRQVPHSRFPNMQIA